MRVIKTAPIRFDCKLCGATCEGDPSEFARSDKPSTWVADCAYCGARSECRPDVLVRRGNRRTIHG